MRACPMKRAFVRASAVRRESWAGRPVRELLLVQRECLATEISKFSVLTKGTFIERSS